MHFGEVFHRLTMICFKYKVNLEATFIRFIFAVTILEGVGKSLDPDLDLLQIARPFMFGLLNDTKNETIFQVRKWASNK